MNVRKWSVVGMLAGLLGIAGLALAGSLIVGSVFLALLTIFVLAHATLLCSRCENDCCALNPTSVDFLFGRPRTRTEYHEPGDNRWVPIALAVMLPFGIWGAWQFSVPGLIACLALITISFLGYRDKSCRHCPHDCPLVPQEG